MEHVLLDRHSAPDHVVVAHDPLEDVQPQWGREEMNCLLELIRIASNIQEFSQFPGHQGSKLERPMKKFSPNFFPQHPDRLDHGCAEPVAR